MFFIEFRRFFFCVDILFWSFMSQTKANNKHRALMDATPRYGTHHLSLIITKRKVLHFEITCITFDI